MRISKYKCPIYLVAGAALIGLQGCKATNQAPEPTPIVIQEPVVVAPPETVIEAEPGLSLKQRFANALSYLESGKTPYALAELNEYNRERPGNPRVLKLIQQIQTPVAELYPEEFFELSLRSGQSLSTLSKKYLGSALDFYALAKYNGIENAKRVLIGQTVKIPKTQLAKTVRQKELDAQSNEPEMIESEIVEALDMESSSSEELEIGKADALLTAQDKDLDLGKIESELLNQGMAKEASDELELAKASFGEASLDNVDTAEPKEIQDKTAALSDGEESPIDSENPDDLAEFEPVRTEQVILQEISAHQVLGEYTVAMGKLKELEAFDYNSLTTNKALVSDVLLGYAEQVQEDNPVEASKTYMKVLELYASETDEIEQYYLLAAASELDPENQALVDRQQTSKAELAQKYHRQASSAFRRQELDSAILDWDIVLNIDPEHENAKVFRAQAVELRERLNQLQ